MSGKKEQDIQHKTNIKQNFQTKQFYKRCDEIRYRSHKDVSE